jgi:hypothetical protein
MQVHKVVEVMISYVICKLCSLYIIWALFLPKGIVDILCEACEQLQWKSPSKIQKEAIPVALQGTVPYSLKYVALTIYIFLF